VGGCPSGLGVDIGGAAPLVEAILRALKCSVVFCSVFILERLAERARERIERLAERARERVSAPIS